MNDAPAKLSGTGIITPGRPDLTTINALHRGSDAFVTFHTNLGGKWRTIGSLRASDISGAFPEILEDLLRDSYHSINAFYRKGTRKTGDLRYLTACYADIDVHDKGLDATRAIVAKMAGDIVELQVRGALPYTSSMVLSGRGVWLFWVLYDAKDASKPQPAYPEKRHFYARIQRAINERLASIGADAGATDAARVTRVPGSVNTAAGDFRVSYSLQFNDAGKVFAYTLDELAEWFTVKPPEFYNAATAQAFSEAEREKKRSGHRALWQRRLRELEVLRVLRGGFRDGTRNHAALLFAVTLTKNKAAAGDVLAEVGKLGEECLDARGERPCPLTDDEVAGAVRSRFACPQLTDATISDWLDVTPDEAAALEKLRPASRFLPEGERVQERQPSKQAQEREERRAVIAGQVNERRCVPKLEDMQELLRQCGIAASPETIRRDYNALGVRNPRRHKPHERHAGLFV